MLIHRRAAVLNASEQLHTVRRGAMRWYRPLLQRLGLLFFALIIFGLLRLLVGFKRGLERGISYGLLYLLRCCGFLLLRARLRWRWHEELLHEITRFTRVCDALRGRGLLALEHVIGDCACYGVLFGHVLHHR